MIDFNPLTYKAEPLTNSYLRLSNKIPFTKSKKNDPIERAVLKGIARFVASFIFLRFFSYAGMIYNGAGALGKGLNGAVHLFHGDEKQAGKLFKKAAQHAVCGLVDGVGAIEGAPVVFGVAHAIVPRMVERGYEAITEMVTGKQVNLAHS